MGMTTPAPARKRKGATYLVPAPADLVDSPSSSPDVCDLTSPKKQKRVSKLESSDSEEELLLD